MKVLIYLIICSALTSCTFNCDDVRKAYFQGKSCKLVIERNESAPRNIDVYGYNPDSNERIAYKDGGGIYIDIIESIEVGDTLQKGLKDEFFLLKKTGMTIKYGLKCDANDVFVGTTRDTLIRK